MKTKGSIFHSGTIREQRVGDHEQIIGMYGVYGGGMLHISGLGFIVAEITYIK